MCRHMICIPSDFNPRSPCGERPVSGAATFGAGRISIHAPRVGSDSPYSPDISRRCRLFQSTLPVWGATQSQAIIMEALQISIHAPRVGSDSFGVAQTGHKRFISIHAPRVGSDFLNPWSLTTSAKFQSTLPVWGATLAPLRTSRFFPDFNPRSPCGERLGQHAAPIGIIEFQSTLPVWGATIAQN